MVLACPGRLWGTLIFTCLLFCSALQAEPTTHAQVIDQAQSAFLMMDLEPLEEAPQAMSFASNSRGVKGELYIMRKPNGWWSSWVHGKYQYIAQTRIQLKTTFPATSLISPTITNDQPLSTHIQTQNLLAYVAEETFANPHKFDSWKLETLEGTHELRFRRWIVTTKNIQGGPKAFESVKAEFQLEDASGTVFIFSKTVTDREIHRGGFKADGPLIDWLAQRTDKRVERSPREHIRGPIWIELQPAETRVDRTGRRVFASHSIPVSRHHQERLDKEIDAQEDILARMEKETYPWSYSSLAQLRDLVKEPGVRIFFGKAKFGESMVPQIVSYLILRERQDHLEILSAGALKAFTNVGAVEQLLDFVKVFLRDKRSFLVAGFVESEVPWLQNAGFELWPKEAKVPEFWVNLHRGNSILARDERDKPLSGELQVSTSGKGANFMFFGDPPEHIAPLPVATPKLSFEDQVSYGELYDTWEPGGLLDADGDGAVLNGEDRPGVIKELDKMQKMLAEVKAAHTAAEVRALSDRVIDEFSVPEIERFLRIKMTVPFLLDMEQMSRFLSDRSRACIDSAEMAEAIAEYLKFYRRHEGDYKQAEIEAELRRFMNHLRSISAPTMREFGVRAALRAAEHMEQYGRFPSSTLATSTSVTPQDWTRQPRFTAKIDPALTGGKSLPELPEDNSVGALLRKGTLPLRSIHIPDFDITKPPPIILHVMLLNRSCKSVTAPCFELGLLTLRAPAENALYAPHVAEEERTKEFYTWMDYQDQAYPTSIRLTPLLAHLWTADYIHRPLPVRIAAGREAEAGFAGVEPPKEHLFIASWLVVRESESVQKLYMLLASDDMNWHYRVVSPRFLEPAEYRVLKTHEKALPESLRAHLNCQRALVEYQRLADIPKKN